MATEDKWLLIRNYDLWAHSPNTCIPNFLTHEDIANLIGSSRQTITTLFNELAADGLITYNRQDICFPDVKKLQNHHSVA